MTYAADMFSWYAGSVEADVYFCPERHGTYFGGFYMKDMPAMGKRDYDISLSRTGDGGSDFLDTLTAEQRAWVDRTLASLSLREQVGQMVMVWVLGDYTSTSDPSFVEMFANEARLAARLSHPNIVTVYEAGETDGVEEAFVLRRHVPGLVGLHLAARDRRGS